MKTTYLFLTLTLFLVQNISFSQTHQLYGTTLVGVNVQTYDTTGYLLVIDTADVHCVWTPNEDFSQLVYAEYLEDGKLFRSIKFSILDRSENDEVRRLIVQNGDDVFSMLFWKDGTMVVYEMGDQVTLLTGEVEY